MSASCCWERPACYTVKSVGRARARGCAGGRYPFLTAKERDIETGLDYFGARYYASTQGRFTSPDNVVYSKRVDPQTWNQYTYCRNGPLSRIDPDGHNYFYVHNKTGDAWEWHDGSDYNGQHSDYTNLLIINVSAPDENGRRSATLTLYSENWKQEVQENGYVGAEGARGNEPVKAGEYFVNVGNYSSTSTIIKDKNGKYVLAPSKDGVQINEPPVLRDKHGNALTSPTVYGNSNTYDLFRQIWGTKRANLSAATWVDGQPTYSPGRGTVWYIHGHDSFARGQNTLGCVGTPEERVLNWLTNSATGKTAYDPKVPLPVSVKY